MRVRTLGAATIAVLLLAGCSLVRDDKPKSPAAPLTQEEVTAALLTIDDMPAGFSLGTTPDDNGRGVCGQPAASSVVPSLAEARISFTRGAAGPVVQQVSASYEQAKAVEYMAKVRESSTCTTYADEEADGIVSNNTVAEVSFPKLGDDTLALRVGNDHGLNADIVFIRIGDTVTRVGVAGLTIDSALTEEVARKAEAKMKDRLG